MKAGSPLPSVPICNSGMRTFNRDASSSARQLPVRTALNAEGPTLSCFNIKFRKFR